MRRSISKKQGSEDVLVAPLLVQKLRVSLRVEGHPSGFSISREQRSGDGTVAPLLVQGLRATSRV